MIVKSLDNKFSLWAAVFMSSVANILCMYFKSVLLKYFINLFNILKLK